MAPSGQYPNLPQLAELLLGCGFTEPVMDVDHHQIIYASAEALTTQLRQLAIDTRPPDAGGDHALTFELIVAAAFVAEPRTGASESPGGLGARESAVPLSAIRRRAY